MADQYDIVTQVPRVRAAPGAGFVDVMVVTFKTKPSGQVGTVDIPTDGYSAEVVDRIVAPLAATIEAVQVL